MTKCQLCGKQSLKLVLDLGEQPICNSLLSKQNLKEHEAVYPLRLYVCTSCWLAQLQKSAPQEEVFGSNYNYLSGTSKELVSYFKGFADKLKAEVKLGKSDLVVDIGGNDGTLLANFKDTGALLLNVEPTPLPAKACKERGIKTLERYFDTRAAEYISKYMGKAKVVLAFNVLAHCYDVKDFLSGVKTILAEDGVFITQSHYLPALIEQLEFDTIYHEHLRYYTLTTLSKLLSLHRLYVCHAEINDVYGGSILTYCSTANTRDDRTDIPIIASEKKYRKLSTYLDFHDQVVNNAFRLINYLRNLKASGKRIVGVGAPMKSATLLNYCGIGTSLLDYLTEVNPLKIGKLSPGTRIPIVDEEEMFKNPPDYGLLLSWNFAEEIVRKLRAKGFKGGFIHPIPQFHVINEVVSFEDDRGVIVDVLTDESIEHVNYITMVKGSVRGNHYHRQSIHYNYVLHGRIRFIRKMPYGAVREQCAEEGDLIFTGMNERHALRALVDSEIMVFTRGPRGGRNYESDTFKLPEGEQLT